MATKDPPQAAGLTDAEMAAWHGLLRAHSALVRELDAQMHDAHGLSLTQYEVLLLLTRSDDGAMRMTDLADGALLSLSGLSRLVDRLTDMGLVERAECPTDRRGAFACITPVGRERFAKARGTHLEGVRRLFIDRLPDGSAAMLGETWEALEGPRPSPAT